MDTTHEQYMRELHQRQPGHLVALESKPDLIITHYPAHMFISDIVSEQQTMF
jgi:hypothetical protein